MTQATPDGRFMHKNIFFSSPYSIQQLEAASEKFFKNNENFGMDPESGTDVNIIDSELNCLTPIHVAAGTGYVNLYETLIQNLEEIQPKDEGGQTPLHYAAGNGYLEVSNLIMEKIQVL